MWSSAVREVSPEEGRLLQNLSQEKTMRTVLSKLALNWGSQHQFGGRPSDTISMRVQETHERAK